MGTSSIINKLQQMDQLIRLKATGSPQAFASRLGISKSALYRYIELLKSLGGPIRYSKEYGSYEYAYPVELVITYRDKRPFLGDGL